jgi:hypothetical protein
MMLESRSKKQNAEIVHRIPYAEIEDLPDGLRPMAASLKEMVDMNSFYELTRSMAVHHYSTLARNDNDGFIAEI